MQPVGWRIYYTDGSKVDSAQSIWAAAPGTNVQAVLVFMDVRPYKNIYMGQEEYVIPGETVTKKTGKAMNLNAWNSFIAPILVETKWPGEV